MSSDPEDVWGQQGLTPSNPGDQPAQISEETAKIQRARIMKLIQGAGTKLGYTCKEIEALTGGSHEAYSRALRSLSKGEFPTLWKSSLQRKNPSGRDACVYMEVFTAVSHGHTRLEVPPILCPHCGERVNEK